MLDRLQSARTRTAAPTTGDDHPSRREVTPVRRELVPPDPAPADVSLGYDGRTAGLEAAAISRFALEIRELRFVVDETHYVDAGGGLATLSDAYEIGMVPFEPVPLCETVAVPTCDLESIQLLYAITDLECDREVNVVRKKGIVEVPLDREIATGESYEIRLFVRFRQTGTGAGSGAGFESETAYRLELHEVGMLPARP
ncbi:hypothetical protein B1756_07920 [Natrarchaeobaculum aegyptiacum]|uniref:Uncharacterized protein n=1 Tax=Natrarchaeobaculum aegyptiacum TaxID=745377 RepID=A0A2Z2HXH7_9EURY|nr:hypothetical protein B1756_07920 [Natrarchaeobaculum aegyptiacum]